MSTLNYTLIDADSSADRDDSSIEAEASVSPGNALKVYQFDSFAQQEYELMRTTAGSEPRGSGEGLIIVGSPSNLPWVSLDADGDTPDGSGSEQRVNIDGAVRGRGFLDELGRDIVGLLDNLLPAAPDLQTYDAPDTGDISSGSGKIGVAGPSFLSQNATVSVDGDKTADPSERGIIDQRTPPEFTGDLNFDVDGSGTNIYADDAFGPGNRGHLELVINGNRPTGTEDGDNTNDGSRYFDLTDLSAQDTTSSSSTSGFDVNAAQSVQFENGETYDEGYQRTGQYFLKFSDGVFNANDVNEVEVRHYISGSVYSSTNRLRFFLDAQGDAIDINTTSGGGDPAIGSLTLTSIGQANGGKSLSGVKYADGATAPLNYIISNVYQTSYENSGNGIGFQNVQNTATTSAAIPDNSAATDDLLVADQSAGTGEIRPADDRVYNLRAGNDALGFGDGPDAVTAGDFQVELVIRDPIESSAVSSTATGGYNLLVDTVKDQPNWKLEEDFIIEGENQGSSSEGTRIQEGNITFSSDVSSSGIDGTNARYDPTRLIADGGSSPYTDELQVYNRQLVYPSTDFSSATDNFDPSTSDADYSVAGAFNRQYVGFAEDTTSNTKDFAIAVNASNSTLVEAETLTSGTNEVSLEMRIGGGNDTGWLDVTIPSDQTGGCFASTNGASQSFNGNDIGIIMDSFSSGTSGAGGRIFYRFTYPDGGTAVIDDVQVKFL